MASRARLGLVFSYDENWIGGTYYLLNLVRSLGRLPDERRPCVVVLAERPEDAQRVRATGYPYVQYRPLVRQFSFLERVGNSLNYRLRGRRLWDGYVRPDEIDVLFPASFTAPYGHVPPRKMLSWIPDLQERHLQQFFTQQQLEWRHTERRRISQETPDVVLSSQAVKRDYERWYADSVATPHVVNFAVQHPPYEHLSLEALCDRYEIDSSYFLVANQFWAHKNHAVVLRALSHLLDQGVVSQVVFTGKDSDSRGQGCSEQLHAFVTQEGLERCVRFVGFVPREEQLRLMRGALAVIQPSLFEGWSTVVEDCKAMGQFVLLSDLPVHREQTTGHVRFFAPDDDAGLAMAMSAVQNDPPGLRKVDYEPRQRRFGSAFADILEQMVGAGPATMAAGRR